jgi:hypothetical protein
VQAAGARGGDVGLALSIDYHRRSARTPGKGGGTPPLRAVGARSMAHVAISAATAGDSVAVTVKKWRGKKSREAVK